VRGFPVTVEHDDRESGIRLREACLAPLGDCERAPRCSRVVICRKAPLVAANVSTCGVEERNIEPLYPANAAFQPLERSACRHECRLPCIRVQRILRSIQCEPLPIGQALPVEDAEFDVRYQRLLRTLNELVALLRRYDEIFWAERMESDRAKMERGDAFGLRHLLSAFGGMGSLNDLLIQPLNGHRVGEAEVRSINEQLRLLTSAVWSDADAMVRELEGP
jgi:hypothetical protein